MANKYLAKQYIEDVLSGKQVACKWVKLAVERHVNDLKRRGQEDFPYTFDEEAATDVIDFIQELKHSIGKWKGIKIILEPFQQFELWVLFGWKNKAGKRRFRKAYVEVARKNGKTTKGAAIGNYCFIADGEGGAECYTAATKRDQASISHKEATRQIGSNKILKEMVTIYATNMSIKGSAAKYVPLGQDSKVEDGLNPHFVLIDEYHAHPDDGMVNVLQSGMGSREQPLMYIITTAGFEKNCACYKERERAIRILEGSSEDETYFAIIYTLDKGDDWTNEDVWIKANPNIDVSVSREFIRDQVREAQDSPTKQNNVKTKNMNIWTQIMTRWILEAKWEACGFPVDENKLRNRICYGGLDLSSTQDITAAVYCFPPLEPGGKYEFVYRFFIPGDNVLQREAKDKVPYQYWIDNGFILTTPGDVVDYDFVENQILEDAEIFSIQEIAYDPWHAQEIINHMSDRGFVMVPFSQKFPGMGPPTSVFEKRVLSGEIAHNNNPVMKWMVACTEVKSDGQANIMPVKPRREATGKRIDGVVASIMALDRAWRNESAPSIYEDKNFRTVGELMLEEMENNETKS